MKSERVEEIDIIKAVAIVFMVLGHAGTPGTGFFFLFHMAVFFIASGYTYKPESSDSFDSLKKSTVKRIKRLWFPSFFWTALFVLLNNWLIKVNIYSDNPELLTYTNGIKIMNLTKLAQYLSPDQIFIRVARCAVFPYSLPVVASLWFLKCLFLVTLLYSLTDWFTKNILHKNPLPIHASVSVLFLGLGYLAGVRDIGLGGFANVASYYHLFFIGTLLNRYRDKTSDWHTKQFLPALLVSFGVLIGLYFYGGRGIMIDLAHNRYTNPAFFLTASTAGWVFCYSAAWFLKRSRLRSPLLYIGRRTMSILILHCLAFKIVSAVVISVRHLPEFCLAANPHLYGDSGLWWLAFTVVGISCPLLINLVYEKAKPAIERKLADFTKKKA